MVAGSLVVASPASAVTASYTNPLATADTSDRDVTSVDVDYNESTISLTAHTQNIPQSYIFAAYFAQGPASFSSGQMESAQVSIQGTTETYLSTYQDGDRVSDGDGSLVNWNRDGDAITLTIPSSAIPWGGDVYASAIVLLTDQPQLDFHYAGTSVDSNGATAGFGPIQKGQIGTATNIALSVKSQKHGVSGASFVASVSPASAPGAVVFFDGPTPIGTVAQSGGSATLAAPATFSDGSHAIHAVFYPSDTNYSASLSPTVTFTVVSSGKSTKTKVHASSSTQRYKKSSVRIAVKLSSKHAAGKVVLYAGKKKLSSATLKKGRAHLTVTKKLSRGTHKLTVKYVPKNPDAYSTSRSKVVRIRVVR